MPNPNQPLTHIDLFSGIGGFALAAKWAGFETKVFCEIDPFCRKVLKKHWPNVPIVEDIKKFDGKEWTGATLLTGGFPCQDLSFAKKGAEGLKGKRSGLWFEFVRIVNEARPKFGIVENVSALLDRGLSDVLRTLASIGYDAEWHCIPASYIGACHRRDRIWITFYPIGSSVEGLDIPKSIRSYSEESCGWEFTRTINAALPADDYARMRGDYDGVSNVMDRLRSLGNAVVPQIPYVIMKAIKESI